eukprot:TRINITY_DN85028_c0_g1_i1.p1 TRINITY_DN85028_c0_g1~~TRINITY_DN85028_c0_g1_i1.p1  ORF type:complete len:656 (+),score=152.50 TRINITY_DN85028_c0_g1_i1:64-2031(+)
MGDSGKALCEDDLFDICRRKVPGPSVFDATPSNINDYCCGSFSLIERDVNAVLPQALAGDVIALLREVKLPDAFRLREELINYKKVLLHDHHEGLAIERTLAQLTAFFHDSDVEERAGGYFEPTPRLAELSDSRMQCKGRCEAAYDARLLSKLLCCLPRHPDKGRPDALEKLPSSLRCWSLAAGAAKEALSGAGEQCLGGYTSTSQEASLATGEPTHWTEPAAEQEWQRQAEKRLQAQPWPDHIRRFVKMVVICRGGDKALRMRDDLSRTSAAIAQTLKKVQDALAKLLDMPRINDVARQAGGQAELAHGEGSVSGSRRLMGAAIRRQKHINLLTGCTPPLREALRWLKAIEAATEAGEAQLFLAGDGRAGGRVLADAGLPPAICVPAGFEGCRAADKNFQRVVLEYTPQMRRVLATTGWPDSIVQKVQKKGREDACENGTEKAWDKRPPEKVCRICDLEFSTLWVHRGVCCECEHACRTAGRCPFNPKCEATWFCQHAGRCFVCDAHACEECRLLRGDGELVLGLVSSLKPARVALDFDRTVATTKSGALPVFGKHGIDNDLLSLLTLHREACIIVTRNSHTKEISEFLTAHGAPEDIPVRSLKRPKSKAEFVLDGLRPEDRVVFVDDSVPEVVDPALARDSRVHRVLFVRALL